MSEGVTPVLVPEAPNRVEAVLQLGRYGDLINLLPLFYKDFQRTGQKSHVIVAREFADLFEGVSYVEPHVFDGPAHDLEGAIKFGETFASGIRVSQVLGPPDLIKRYVFDPMGRGHALTESFQKEAWMALGRFHEWREQLPLVFDQRSPEREHELVTRYRDHRKKTILLHATGNSSPFPFKELLLELVRLKFKRGFNVVDLGEVKAERIYDLLGLLEKAWALIAVDSAILHLAYACPDLPVVALVNDRPVLWNGSVWRPNHVAHIRYNDFPRRAPEMLQALDNLCEPGVWPFCRPMNDTPQIIHTWSQYELVEDTINSRHEEVYDAWLELYAQKPAQWIRCPIEVGAMGRDTRSALRDHRRFPYVRDVLRLAMQRARDNDIICLTRADTAFIPCPEFTQKILKASERPLFSHRWVFTKTGAQYHPAVDLFAFTKAWWRERQAEYPDFALGLDPYWHQTLKLLLLKHGGVEEKFLTFRAEAKPNARKAEKPAKYVPKNEDLRGEWFKRNHIIALAPAVAAQVPTEVINRRALSPAGYNPSIVEFQSRRLMAYRWHDEHNPSTSLVMAELNRKNEVIANREIDIPGASLEDPRLFVLRGALYICYVDSTWPALPPTSVVRYARLVEGAQWKLEEIHQPALPGNDGKEMQKNWVMFEHENRLMCVHHTSPEQVVYELRGPEIVNEWRTPTPHWQWGAVRGGTVPVPYSEHRLLRLVHSRLDNEPAPNYWRYYVAAALCEDKPPFGIRLLSREPVLVGSEADDTTDMERSAINHRKANVVFPAGILAEEGGWCVSVGINDCSCALVHLDKDSLKL